MSAFAYINIEDIPAALRESSTQHPDEITGVPLIGFDDCPLIGEVRRTTDVPDEGTTQVEFPFPRNPQIRNDLVAWFVNHGINFTVVM
ncbi:phage portal protein [Paraburkholderia fungorum]|uniref:phage portal protein n=1 Tax=Paraburkholderia fungorum TaxID=134537 RepID=UPI000D06D356|nr:phage portal protein [Paraburkholderia fungorum]PRZ56159.1 hypothetical protein BX589_102360 [Paraburkholderia fungorum]